MGWEGESRGIPHLAKNERDVGHPKILGGGRGCRWETHRLPSRLLRPMGWKGESCGIPHLAKNERDVGTPQDSWWGWGLLDKRWCGLGGFVGDVGLDGVLHQLAAAVERQLFFDVSLVGFDGFYAEV
jgi:hypothetical protein